MPGVKFTDTYVRNLKPKAERHEVREDLAKGNGKLALRVSPNGHKAWQYVYTVDGRNRRMTLGAYPAMSIADAHAACGEAMRQRSTGIDPGALAVEAHVVERGAPTFAVLAARYLEQHAKPRKKDGGARDDSTLKRDVLPHFGPHKAEAIQRKDVRALLQAIVDRGAPVQANRTLALVRKVFNWGIGEDLVSHNPCIGVRAPGKETQRDRVLSDAELQAFFKALPTSAMSKESRLALRMLLLTGQRCGEVLGMRWDEVDLQAGWWTIPAAKAKNGLPHRVPVSEQAAAVLAEARALNPDRQTVFPSPRADGPMVETAVALAVRRNLEHFKIAEAFTPHDLRRTAASNIAGMGFGRTVVSMILNHVERGVTAVYDRHGYDKEKRKALTAWGGKVHGLASKAAREGRLAGVAA